MRQPMRLFRICRHYGPSVPCLPLLDLGSGSGAASWAACTQFESLHTATLFERDPDPVALGQRLARAAALAPMDKAQWNTCSLQQAVLPQADLVIASYVLNELTEKESTSTARTMWHATKSALVIVEPGTTACFNHLNHIRSVLIDEGAHLPAPLPPRDLVPIIR